MLGTCHAWHCIVIVYAYSLCIQPRYKVWAKWKGKIWQILGQSQENQGYSRPRHIALCTLWQPLMFLISGCFIISYLRKIATVCNWLLQKLGNLLVKRKLNKQFVGQSCSRKAAKTILEVKIMGLSKYDRCLTWFCFWSNHKSRKCSSFLFMREAT